MLARLLIRPVLWYQRWLSPMKRFPTCRYTPTCSTYAVEALSRRGAVVGLALAFWRLLRCNPLFAGGYDPVPLPRAKWQDADKANAAETKCLEHSRT